MTSIRKSILVSGNPHFVEVNSSLDLEEVEITGTDPATGKTVHVSLSSLLKTPRNPEPSPYNPQPLQGLGSPATGSPYGTPPSASPPSFLDLSMPSPSSLSASGSPPAMDMFSDPAPTITPPLGNAQPASPTPSWNASDLPAPTWGEQTAASTPPLTATPEIIQAKEPQGLEALDDPLPSLMESAGDEVSIEPPMRRLTPAMRKSDIEELDEHLDSMYKR